MFNEGLDEEDDLIQGKITGRYYNWVFTINNYTDNDIKMMEAADYTYLAYGKEIGEKKKTPHIHGMYEFKGLKSRKALKEFLPRGWYKPRNGTAEQAIAYLSKDGDVKTFGTLKAPGKRNDLIAIKESIQSGEIQSFSAAVELCSNFQSLRIAEKLLPVFENKRNWKPHVSWFYGGAGAGKSRLAYAILGSELFPVSYSTKFFIGYDGHPNVLYDDFRKDSIHFNDFLKQLDRYPMFVEIKGGHRQFVPRMIVITSDKSPYEMWTGNDLDQVIRRLDVCKQVYSIKLG